MGPTGLNPEELMNVVYKKERDRYKNEVEELGKMLDD